MSIYIIVLLVLYIRCFTARHDADRRERFFWIVPILLIGIAGLRYGPGSDFLGYLVNFEYSAGDVEFKSSFELGFRVLMDLIIAFKGSFQCLIIITSVVTTFLIAKGIEKYSQHTELSMYLYVGLYFYFISFNLIRQYIAVAIVFWGTKYLLEKNLKKYVVVILIASLFHATALIMIPFYFVAVNKISTKIKLFLGVLAFAGVVFFNQLQDIFLALFPKYIIYVGYASGTAKCDLIIILMVIFLLHNIKSKAGNEFEWNLYMSTAVFALLFIILSFSNILLARLGTYFYMYSILSIPYTLKHMRIRDRKFVRLSVCTLAFAVCIYYLVHNNAGVVPYSTVLGVL